jgi:hypothetical protein
LTTDGFPSSFAVEQPTFEELMAKVELNENLGGLRGKIDDWVYRRQNGQTIVTSYRAPRKTKQSAAQKQTRLKFQAAQAYAAEVLADPLQRLVYQKLGADRKRPPNALLVANFLTPPVIEKIETSGYQGRAGGVIRIVAFDPIEVAAVTVTIREPNGTRVESGDAEHSHGVWNYRTTAHAPSAVPLHIDVAARNRARTEAKQTVVK